MAHPMVFAIVFDALSPTDQNEIRSRLTTLAKSSPIGRQIEANVALETRLPGDAAEELVAGLLNERNDPDRLRVKMWRSVINTFYEDLTLAAQHPRGWAGRLCYKDCARS